MIDNIVDQLKRDEGEVLHVYLDQRGIPTAGVGHNLPAHNITLPVSTPITQAQCDTWLLNDIEAVMNAFHVHAPWVWSLDVVRRGVLTNMAFNMGWGTLSTFHTFLSLVEAGRYDAAAADMITTLWAKQVGPRAIRLAIQMRTGTWQ